MNYIKKNINFGIIGSDVPKYLHRYLRTVSVSIDTFLGIGYINIGIGLKESILFFFKNIFK